MAEKMAHGDQVGWAGHFRAPKIAGENAGIAKKVILFLKKSWKQPGSARISVTMRRQIFTTPICYD
jgi:hypothetical protein